MVLTLVQEGFIYGFDDVFQTPILCIKDTLNRVQGLVFCQSDIDEKTQAPLIQATSDRQD